MSRRGANFRGRTDRLVSQIDCTRDRTMPRCDGLKRIPRAESKEKARRALTSADEVLSRDYFGKQNLSFSSEIVRSHLWKLATIYFIIEIHACKVSPYSVLMVTRSVLHIERIYFKRQYFHSREIFAWIWILVLNGINTIVLKFTNLRSREDVYFHIKIQEYIKYT